MNSFSVKIVNVNTNNIIICMYIIAHNEFLEFRFFRRNCDTIKTTITLVNVYVDLVVFTRIAGTL